MTRENGRGLGIGDALASFRRKIGLYTKDEMRLILEEALHIYRHDLRSPTTSILGNAQLLERSQNDPERTSRSLTSIGIGVRNLVAVLDSQSESAPELIRNLAEKVDELKEKEDQAKRDVAEYLARELLKDPAKQQSSGEKLN